MNNNEQNASSNGRGLNRRGFLANTFLLGAGFALAKNLMASSEGGSKQSVPSNVPASADGKAKSVLIINTHLKYPGWSEGTLNMAFMDHAKKFFVEHGRRVAETFVERGYDPEEEVAKHVAADLVILQMPVNWFGAPWIYKKYVDEVFNVGLNKKIFLSGDGRSAEHPTRQYGTGGKMQGRKFMVSATRNAPKETFDNPDSLLFAGKGTADLFLPITSNYKFIGFDILPDTGVYDIYQKRAEIPRAFEDYTRHLEKYCL